MSTLYFSRVFVVGLALVVSGALLQAQEHAEKAAEHPDHVMVVPAALTWTDGPASLPAGAQFVVLEGDPAQMGPFTMRLKLPANYKISPHYHPAVEHVTVLSGSFFMGLGDTFDESLATQLPVGGFAVMDVETRHFAFTQEETVVQLHGIGPWGITYVNPADDPRRKAAK